MARTPNLPDADFDASLHPRDRRGRFIETGSLVSILGGARGKVIRSLPNDRLEVQRADNGETIVTRRGYVTVITRPDGSKPTDKVEDTAEIAQGTDAPDAPTLQAPGSPAPDAPSTGALPDGVPPLDTDLPQIPDAPAEMDQYGVSSLADARRLGAEAVRDGDAALHRRAATEYRRYGAYPGAPSAPEDRAALAAAETWHETQAFRLTATPAKVRKARAAATDADGLSATASTEDEHRAAAAAHGAAADAFRVIGDNATRSQHTREQTKHHLTASAISRGKIDPTEPGVIPGEIAARADRLPAGPARADDAGPVQSPGAPAGTITDPALTPAMDRTHARVTLRDGQTRDVYVTTPGGDTPLEVRPARDSDRVQTVRRDLVTEIEPLEALPEPTPAPTETVKATAAVRRDLEQRLAAQGADETLVAVLTDGRASHYVVATGPDGTIIGGAAIVLDGTGRNASPQIVNMRVIARRGGTGTQIIAEAARLTGSNGDLSVGGAVPDAKPFYARTGADFPQPDSGRGTWSREAVQALQRGETPPRGEALTEWEYRRREAEAFNREYPTMPPLETPPPQVLPRTDGFYAEVTLTDGTRRDAYLTGPGGDADVDLRADRDGPADTVSRAEIAAVLPLAPLNEAGGLPGIDFDGVRGLTDPVYLRGLTPDPDPDPTPGPDPGPSIRALADRERAGGTAPDVTPAPDVDVTPAPVAALDAGTVLSGWANPDPDWNKASHERLARLAEHYDVKTVKGVANFVLVKDRREGARGRWRATTVAAGLHTTNSDIGGGQAGVAAFARWLDSDPGLAGIDWTAENPLANNPGAAATVRFSMGRYAYHNDRSGQFTDPAVPGRPVSDDFGLLYAPYYSERRLDPNRPAASPGNLWADDVQPGTTIQRSRGEIAHEVTAVDVDAVGNVTFTLADGTTAVNPRNSEVGIARPGTRSAALLTPGDRVTGTVVAPPEVYQGTSGGRTSHVKPVEVRGVVVASRQSLTRQANLGRTTDRSTEALSRSDLVALSGAEYSTDGGATWTGKAPVGYETFQGLHAFSGDPAVGGRVEPWDAHRLALGQGDGVPDRVAARLEAARSMAEVGEIVASEPTLAVLLSMRIDTLTPEGRARRHAAIDALDAHALADTSPGDGRPAALVSSDAGPTGLDGVIPGTFPTLVTTADGSGATALDLGGGLYLLSNGRIRRDDRDNWRHATSRPVGPDSGPDTALHRIPSVDGNEYTVDPVDGQDGLFRVTLHRASSGSRQQIIDGPDADLLAAYAAEAARVEADDNGSALRLTLLDLTARNPSADGRAALARFDEYRLAEADLETTDGTPEQRDRLRAAGVALIEAAGNLDDAKSKRGGRTGPLHREAERNVYAFAADNGWEPVTDRADLETLAALRATDDRGLRVALGSRYGGKEADLAAEVAADRGLDGDGWDPADTVRTAQVDAAADDLESVTGFGSADDLADAAAFNRWARAYDGTDDVDDYDAAIEAAHEALDNLTARHSDDEAYTRQVEEARALLPTRAAETPNPDQGDLFGADGTLDVDALPAPVARPVVAPARGTDRPKPDPDRAPAPSQDPARTETTTVDDTNIGDTVLIDGRAATITGSTLSDDGSRRSLDVSYADGTSETFDADPAYSLERVIGGQHVDPPPAPPAPPARRARTRRASTRRPNDGVARRRSGLATYQRAIVGEYRLDTDHPDARGRAAALALRNYEAMDSDQARALSGALLDLSGRPGMLPRRRAALQRVSGRFDHLNRSLQVQQAAGGSSRAGIGARNVTPGMYVRLGGVSGGPLIEGHVSSVEARPSGLTVLTVDGRTVTVLSGTRIARDADADLTPGEVRVDPDRPGGTSIVDAATLAAGDRVTITLPLADTPTAVTVTAVDVDPDTGSVTLRGTGRDGTPAVAVLPAGTGVPRDTTELPSLVTGTGPSGTLDQAAARAVFGLDDRWTATGPDGFTADAATLTGGDRVLTLGFPGSSLDPLRLAEPGQPGAVGRIVVGVDPETRDVLFDGTGRIAPSSGRAVFDPSGGQAPRTVSIDDLQEGEWVAVFKPQGYGNDTTPQIRYGRVRPGGGLGGAATISDADGLDVVTVDAAVWRLPSGDPDPAIRALPTYPGGQKITASDVQPGDRIVHRSAFSGESEELLVLDVNNRVPGEPKITVVRPGYQYVDGGYIIHDRDPNNPVDRPGSDLLLLSRGGQTAIDRHERREAQAAHRRAVADTAARIHSDQASLTARILDSMRGVNDLAEIGEGDLAAMLSQRSLRRVLVDAHRPMTTSTLLRATGASSLNSGLVDSLNETLVDQHLARLQAAAADLDVSGPSARLHGIVTAFALTIRDASSQRDADLLAERIHAIAATLRKGPDDTASWAPDADGDATSRSLTRPVVEAHLARFRADLLARFGTEGKVNAAQRRDWLRGNYAAVREIAEPTDADVDALLAAAGHDIDDLALLTQIRPTMAAHLRSTATYYSNDLQRLLSGRGKDVPEPNLDRHFSTLTDARRTVVEWRLGGGARIRLEADLALPTIDPDTIDGDTAAKIAALRAVVGPNAGRRTSVEPKPTVAGLDALLAGKVEWVEGEQVSPDLSSDGGPGATAMHHLAAVQAAGKIALADTGHADREAAYLARQIAIADEIEEVKVDARAAASEIYGLTYGSPEYIAQFGAIRDERLAIIARLNREMVAEPLQHPDLLEVTARYDALRVSSGFQAAADRENALHKRHAALLVEQQTLSAAHREARNSALQRWLANHREMGGDLRYDDTSLDDAGKPATAEAMSIAQSLFPTSWIERSNSQTRPMRVRAGVRRGHYVSNDGSGGREITLSGGAGPGRNRVAVHELGHDMEESVPGILEMERAFFWSRTTEGNLGERIMEREVTVTPGEPSERGRADKFQNAYIGREYHDRAWEILSMGIEALHDTTERSDHFEGDDGYLEFIIGLLTLVD